ncbi:hypothetical protein MT418_001803 [Batrachochytrium dendrobatidis]
MQVFQLAFDHVLPKCRPSTSMIVTVVGVGTVITIAFFEQGRFWITRPVRHAKLRHHWELVVPNEHDASAGLDESNCSDSSDCESDSQQCAIALPNSTISDIDSSTSTLDRRFSHKMTATRPVDLHQKENDASTTNCSTLVATCGYTSNTSDSLTIAETSSDCSDNDDHNLKLGSTELVMTQSTPYSITAILTLRPAVDLIVAGWSVLSKSYCLWFALPEPSVTTATQWRQRLFNSLGVAGRFVNPFIEWQDRNTADLFGYLKWQFTRNNRNNVPSDIKELDQAMPLATPDFGLMEEYTLKRTEMRIQSNSASRRMSDFITHSDSQCSEAKPLKEASLMSITWIGQSTCFVQMDGYNILTDPIFSSRTIGEWFGPKRIRPTPCTLEQLPKIDIVLVSHNHYDHLDTTVVKKLGNSVKWYVPLGMCTWLASYGITNAVELDWWQEHHHDDSLIITGAPIQHWSGRHFLDVNATLWSSFVVQGKTSSFFHCGDTGYCQAFKEIGKRLGPITFASLPIGSYEPREYMKHQHMNPSEACKVHKDIGATFSLGVHWGTFMMSDEYYLDPPAYLEKGRIKYGLKSGSVFTTMLGETITIALDCPSDNTKIKR